MDDYLHGSIMFFSSFTCNECIIMLLPHVAKDTFQPITIMYFDVNTPNLKSFDVFVC